MRSAKSLLLYLQRMIMKTCSELDYDCVVETHIGYDDGLDWWQNQCCQFLKKLKLEFHDPDGESELLF